MRKCVVDMLEDELKGLYALLGRCGRIILGR